MSDATSFPAAGGAVAKATALYARVTRDASIEKGLSIPNQCRRFLEIAQREGWEPTRIFKEDKGTKGDLPPEKRPALSELLAEAEAGRIERVVFRHQDRIGRGDVVTPILRRFADLGIEVWTFDGKLDQRSAAGRFVTRVQAAAGAFETERGGERVREAKRGRAREGIHVGPCPYGYISQSRLRLELEQRGVSKDDARIQAQQQIPVSPGISVDPEEAKVVRAIFAAYLRGEGVRRIATSLNSRGLLRRGGRWHGNTVRKVLHDPKVAGFTTYDEDAYLAGRRGRWAPIHKQAHFKAKHDAIVDKADWDRVQTLMNARRGQLVTQREGHRLYTLTSVLHDAHGHRMKGRSSGKASSIAYYACGLRARVGASTSAGGCDAPPIRADRAESAVLDVLSQVLTTPDAILRAWEAAKRKLAEEAPERKRAVDGIDEQVAALQREREGVFAAFRNPDLGADQHRVLADRVAELNTRIKDLLARKEEVAEKVVPIRARQLTRDEVSVFMSQLRDKLVADPARFRSLVLLLKEHHGLNVTALDAHRLRIILAFDPAKLVADGRGQQRQQPEGGPRIELVLDAQTGERQQRAEEWAAEENAKGHPCACGCGGNVTVAARMRAASKGIPRFIHGHHTMSMTSFVEALNADGYLTIAQAAKELGIGQTTLRRAEARGLITPEWRPWGDRRPMRVYRQEDLSDVTTRLTYARSRG